MSWIKLSDTFRFHPKAVLAKALGRDLYYSALGWSKHHLTDGHIPAAIVPTLVDPEDVKKVPDLCVRLVALRLWELDETPGVDGYVIHDYAETNLTRAEVEADRLSWRDRQQRSRARHAVTPRVTPAVTAGVTTTVTPAEVTPSVSRDSHARTRGRPRSETETETEIQDPISSPLRVDPPVLVDRDIKPPKVKPPRPERPPLPFRCADAVKAIADAAGARFVVPPHIPAGIAISIESTIRRVPDLDDWKLVGRWLAAGGASWAREPFGPSWVASGRFGEALAIAKSWGGRGPIGRSHILPAGPAQDVEEVGRQLVGGRDAR